VNKDFGLYMNFILNALMGGNPKGVDAYYGKNKEAIDSVASVLVKKMKLNPQQVYRGILLDPKEVTDLVLKPMHEILYLSFSTDKEIAEDFADMNSEMSFMVKFQQPHFKGYVIEHIAQPAEILFHHSWAIPLGVGAHLDMEVILKQKEVMLKQEGKKFPLKPFKN
jgi:hypothetical protein